MTDGIRLELFSAGLEVEPEARTIAGVIAVFGVRSTDGRYFETASITPRQPLKRVKLLRDHDKTQPVGYMQALDVDAQRAWASYYIPPGVEGDRALAEAQAGLRDGLSVGAYAKPDGYYFDAANEVHFTAMELVETSLVSVPAWADTGVDSVAAALAAFREKGTTMVEATQQPPALQVVDAQAGAQTPPAPAVPPAQSTPAPPEVTAGPQALPNPIQPVHANPRSQSLQQVTESVSAAIRTGQRGEILAALQNVVPADDIGTGFIGREDWIGQLWQAAKTGRPWVDSFGTPTPLKSMTLTGWAWDVKPKPAKYAGSKADVPSNKPKTKPITAPADRWAGGWDIDRIFFDLGDPSFLASFWAAAIEEYQQDSDWDVATKVLTAATVIPPGADVLADIGIIASELRVIGATVSNIWLATDLWEDYAALGVADVPFWLANQVGAVDLRTGTSSPGGLNIQVDDALPDGTVIGYDNRAATVYEVQPIQVQALDIARGGIDLGFFSYGGVVVNDATAVVKMTAAVTPAESATKAATAK